MGKVKNIMNFSQVGLFDKIILRTTNPLIHTLIHLPPRKINMWFLDHMKPLNQAAFPYSHPEVIHLPNFYASIWNRIISIWHRSIIY